MKTRCTPAVGLLVTIYVVCFAGTVLAGIPEPDVIFYGNALKDGGLLSSAEIVVRVNDDQGMISSYTYRLGSVADYDDRYVLKIPMDALASREGHTACFYIDGDMAGLKKIPSRGTVIELDLETPYIKDSDADGMPDIWEMKYHEGGSGLDPYVYDANGNLDGDRTTNLQEYQDGTDPTDPLSFSDKSWQEEENQGPAAPARNYPGLDSETDSQYPVLSVSNANDPDAQTLGYDFEVYTDAALSLPAAAVYNVQEGSNTTAWQADAHLQDDTFYYWRARADDGTYSSVWMTVARFFVNTANNAPSIPGISMPGDQSEVTDRQPVLEVTNAADSDHDPLTYEIEVYADPDMSAPITAKTGIFEGSGGVTRWQVDVELADNTTYWWLSQARDNESTAGGWTSLNEFTVNTTNAAPEEPTIFEPADNTELALQTPELVVQNASDSDLDLITYFFEIDAVNTFDSADLQRSDAMTEGAGSTTAWTPAQLADNTLFSWRVRAYDGAAFSKWANGSFFVNLSNDAPGAPAIQNPGDFSEATTLAPKLRLHPPLDADRDQLSYHYQLYSDPGLENLVASVDGAGPAWQVEGDLKDKTYYYWCARAVDEHGAAGPFSLASSFYVNTVNRTPMAPTVNCPVSGGFVTSLTPTLSVQNADQWQENIFTYEMEIYSDPDLTNKVASRSVTQEIRISSWHLETPLTDNRVYFWRARTTYGDRFSEWMPTAAFAVDTAGTEMISQIQAYEDVRASAQDAQRCAVTNPDSPLQGVQVVIPPGALPYDTTITIAHVTNPVALPDNTLALSYVMEFGPQGISFLTPVSIKIPYTQQDLDDAGVRDPANLEIYTYNQTTLTWELVPITSVDIQNQLLISEVDHFSMFVSAKSTGGGPGGSAPQGDGGGGGACFIAAASQTVVSGASSALLMVLAALGLPIGCWIINRRQRGFCRRSRIAQPD